jgi:hypothetical protein
MQTCRRHNPMDFQPGIACSLAAELARVQGNLGNPHPSVLLIAAPRQEFASHHAKTSPVHIMAASLNLTACSCLGNLSDEIPESHPMLLKGDHLPSPGSFCHIMINVLFAKPSTTLSVICMLLQSAPMQQWIAVSVTCQQYCQRKNLVSCPSVLLVFLHCHACALVGL